jgi:hypothetical protein
VDNIKDLTPYTLIFYTYIRITHGESYSLHMFLGFHSFARTGTGPPPPLGFACTRSNLTLQFDTISRAPSVKSNRILCRDPPFSAVRVTVGYLQSIDVASRKFYRPKTPPQSSCTSRASSHQTARLLQWLPINLLHFRWLRKTSFFPHRPSSSRFISPRRGVLPDGRRHFPLRSSSRYRLARPPSPAPSPWPRDAICSQNRASAEQIRAAAPISSSSTSCSWLTKDKRHALGLLQANRGPHASGPVPAFLGLGREMGVQWCRLVGRVKSWREENIWNSQVSTPVVLKHGLRPAR